MNEPASRPDLHALLGVADTVGPADLRMAYDRAMAMALRVGDNQRALALSRAFDALPGTVRDRVYPAVQHRRAPIDPYGPGRDAGNRSRGRTRMRARGGAPRRRPGGRRRPGRRTVVVIVLIALLVPLGVIVALHWHEWLTRPHSSSDGAPAGAAAVVRRQASPPADPAQMSFSTVRARMPSVARNADSGITGKMPLPR